MSPVGEHSMGLEYWPEEEDGFLYKLLTKRLKK